MLISTQPPHTSTSCESKGNQALIKEAQRIAALHPGDTGPLCLLVLGCETNTDLDALSQLGITTAMDPSAQAVERAHEHYPQAEILVEDPCSLPFDNVFDLVISDALFHRVPDQVALLKSVAAALVHDGSLIVEMGAEGNIALIQDGYTQALRKHSGDYICQFCFPKESSYRRLLDIAGFEVDRMEVVEGVQPLTGGRLGLRLFAEQHFARSLALYQQEVREQILTDLEQACEEDLWDNEAQCWLTDFRHLRFTARKTRNTHVAGGASQLNVLGS